MLKFLSILLRLAIVVGLFGWLGHYSYEKINAKILENIQVVNHSTIYENEGYPVYTTELTKSERAYFITDITLDGNNNNHKKYTALVSQDKARTLKVGSNVYVPNNEEALRTGFSWEDTAKYTVGKITSISNVADWKTGFYQVNIELDKELAKQPFYSAKVVQTTKENIVVVPISAMDSIAGKYYAWIHDENSQATKHLVETGICDGYNCEVISGLEAGDTIITSDRKLLIEGKLLNDRGEK